MKGRKWFNFEGTDVSEIKIKALRLTQRCTNFAVMLIGIVCIVVGLAVESYVPFMIADVIAVFGIIMTAFGLAQFVRDAIANCFAKLAAKATVKAMRKDLDATIKEILNSIDKSFTDETEKSNVLKGDND